MLAVNVKPEHHRHLEPSAEHHTREKLNSNTFQYLGLAAVPDPSFAILNISSALFAFIYFLFEIDK
jgi:hypothetical protein